jgi:hypothetical protein
MITALSPAVATVAAKQTANNTVNAHTETNNRFVIVTPFF